jgi:hypothetical protein
MSEPEYATWPTKQQAANTIGVSTKTIEKLAADRQIEQALYRPQNRGAAKAVYNPDDVARIASARRPAPAPFVLPAGPTSPGNGNGHHTGISPISPLTGQPSGEEILKLVFAAALRSLTGEHAENREKSQNSEKLFLTIPEAADVSGFSQAYLRRKCQEGWTGAIKDGAWKIRRKDLEAL